MDRKNAPKTESGLAQDSPLHSLAEMERVVTLAGLGDGSLTQFREELGALADELEAAFGERSADPAAVPPVPPARRRGWSRADVPRAKPQAHSWQAAAPEMRAGWLRVPPVRGRGDEDPYLPFASDPAALRGPKPPPPHARATPHPFEDATALVAAIAARHISTAEVFAHYTRTLSQDALSPRVDPFNALVDAHFQAHLEADSAGVGAALNGVPLVVKTNICVQGFTTNCASRALAGWRPPYTATTVRRLQAAGALPFASANMDEFAMGSSGERSAFGATRNPWSGPDVALVPGGSSSGSAAAIAAGLAPLSLGTDAGGSIRQPAALCGVSGLRPSRGRLSRFGVVAFSSSFDTIGPLAKSARDLRLAFDAMVGPDPRESSQVAEWSEALPLPGISQAKASATQWAAGWLVGVPHKLIEQSGLDDAVARSFQASLRELEQAGARLVSIELGGPQGQPDAALSAYHILSCAEAASNLARLDGMRFGPHANAASSFKLGRRDVRERTLGVEARRRILIGTLSLAREGSERLFGTARLSERQTQAEFARAFESCHLIAMPTSPTTAFAAASRINDPMAMYRADLLTVPASLAGVAAVSIPGPHAHLPVGFQLMAAPGRDEALLDLAARYQRACPHHLVSPA